MVETVWVILKGVFNLLKYPLCFVLSIFALFVFLCCCHIVINLAKGRRFQKGQHNKIKKRGFFKRILYDLPKQFVDDLFNSNPEFFKPQGLVIFEGRQGRGKSIAMCEYALRLQEEYPLLKVTSNLDYLYQDTPLKDWRMLMTYKNNIQGVVVLMDELQNWFSSNDSRNFPPEMLSIITQNRKNRRLILGTAQVFSMLAKPIRTQATEVRRCTTLLGCLTIVKRLEPILDSDGNVVEWKKLGMYFFVHNKKLRDSYDTYKVIERLSQVGFKEQQQVPDIINNFSFPKDVKFKK